MLRTLASGGVLAIGIAALAACSPSPLADSAQATDEPAIVVVTPEPAPVVTIEPRDDYTVTPAPETPATQEPGPVIQEDDPRWDCRFDGNEQCGVNIEGVWYVIQFRDGSPEWVGYRGTGE